MFHIHVDLAANLNASLWTNFRGPVTAPAGLDTSSRWFWNQSDLNCIMCGHFGGTLILLLLLDNGINHFEKCCSSFYRSFFNMTSLACPTYWSAENVLDVSRCGGLPLRNGSIWALFTDQW